MARPRKQTYTLEMYLKKINKGEIQNDADVQRRFSWKNGSINALIATVLTDNYIPPIILGEKEDTQLSIVDGGCRSAALMKFRYGNYKITSTIEYPIITYQKRTVDENGNKVLVSEECNIKNKTYEKLPEELKQRFDEYQIETVIHEHCDKIDISKYIQIYNNHVAMNQNQNAFTYLPKFAENVREILRGKFFVEYTVFSENDKISGVAERFVLESIMCVNHFEHWKGSVKNNTRYLNKNSSESEFDDLENNLQRLEKVMVDDVKDIFNKRDAFIFVSLFCKFVELGFEDAKFVDFLKKFKNKFRSERRNEDGLLFDEIGNKNNKDGNIKRGGSTKDKSVVLCKMNMLEALMKEYLHIDESMADDSQLPEEFIASNLGIDANDVKAEMDFYNTSLDELLDNTVKIESKLRDDANRLSLLSMMVYSYVEAIDLDKWMADYAVKNDTYCKDQRRNFYIMKHDFEQYQQSA